MITETGIILSSKVDDESKLSNSVAVAAEGHRYDDDCLCYCDHTCMRSSPARLAATARAGAIIVFAFRTAPEPPDLFTSDSHANVVTFKGGLDSCEGRGAGANLHVVHDRGAVRRATGGDARYDGGGEDGALASFLI